MPADKRKRNFSIWCQALTQFRMHSGLRLTLYPLTSEVDVSEGEAIIMPVENASSRGQHCAQQKSVRLMSSQSNTFSLLLTDITLVS